MFNQQITLINSHNNEKISYNAYVNSVVTDFNFYCIDENTYECNDQNRIDYHLKINELANFNNEIYENNQDCECYYEDNFDSYNGYVEDFISKSLRFVCLFGTDEQLLQAKAIVNQL